MTSEDRDTYGALPPKEGTKQNSTVSACHRTVSADELAWLACGPDRAGHLVPFKMQGWDRAQGVKSHMHKPHHVVQFRTQGAGPP